MAKWIALDLLEYIVSLVKGNGFFLGREAQNHGLGSAKQLNTFSKDLRTHQISFTSSRLLNSITLVRKPTAPGNRTMQSLQEGKPLTMT